MPTFRQADPEYWTTMPDYLRAMVPPEELDAPVHVLGSSEDKDAPAALVLTMPPHYVLPRHAHECFRFEVVVKGSLTNETGQVLVPGDIMTVSPNIMYGPHVAGPDGCTTVEVFSVARANYQMILEQPDGSRRLVDLLQGDTLE